MSVFDIFSLVPLFFMGVVAVYVLFLIGCAIAQYLSKEQRQKDREELKQYKASGFSHVTTGRLGEALAECPKCLCVVRRSSALAHKNNCV